MADGYFVLPRVGSGTRSDPYRPKYLHEPADPNQYPDGPPTRPEVEKYYGSEEMERPAGSGDYYMAVRVFADTQSSLDTLESQSDTYPYTPAQFRDALNAANIFPVDLSGKEWAIVTSHLITHPINETADP